MMVPTKCEVVLTFVVTRLLRNLEKQPSATMVRGAKIS